MLTAYPRRSPEGPRVGAEFLEEAGAAAQFGEGGGNRRLLAVPFHVYEKDIFPGAALEAAGRPRLEAAHRHAVLGERRQQLVHGAGAILRRADEGRLVLA